VHAPVRVVSRHRAAAGLAVGLALVIAGSTLAASRGAPWRVGYVETIATYTTGLSGALAGSVLQITNTNLSTTATAARAIAAITRARRSVALLAQNTAGGPAAHFLVGTTTALSSAAPFITNARGLVTNLNADLLDGLTSADFLRATGKAADADKLDGLDSTALQARVGSTCAVGSSIRAINTNGTVECEADNDGGTTYTGSHPITVSGTSIGLSAERCADGDVYRLGGGEERGWACAPDAVDGGDAATLGGVAPSGYLSSSGKAADADKLDGNDSSAFLGATGKAADADKLDGVDSTGFARIGSCAVRGPDWAVSALNNDGSVSCIRAPRIDVVQGGAYTYDQAIWPLPGCTSAGTWKECAGGNIFVPANETYTISINSDGSFFKFVAPATRVRMCTSVRESTAAVGITNCANVSTGVTVPAGAVVAASANGVRTLSGGTSGKTYVVSSLINPDHALDWYNGFDYTVVHTLVTIYR
jgi:hypothetical protein